MSEYSNRSYSTDLDAFRSDGVVQTTSVTFSGSLAAGATSTQLSDFITVTDADFYQALFENSDKHPGKWKDYSLERVTYVRETTFNSDLVVVLSIQILEEVVQFRARLLNPYGSSVNLTTTTFTFRYVVYDSTLL